MKAMWILIVIAAMALFAIFFWFWSSAFRATGTDSSGDITISPGSDVKGDLVTAGRNVNVQAEIDGDLAVAGANVTVAGPVDGYLMAAGSNVNINGKVDDDLWAAGSQVHVNAPIDDNARLAGSSVILQPQASVGGDAYLAGNVVEVRGRVERDLKVRAVEARLASEIGGSVQARAGSLKVLPGAVIRGDLIAYGPTPPEIAPEAQVLGRVQYQPVGGGRWGLMTWLGWWLCLFLGLLILGAATIALSSWWTGRVAENLTRHFGYSLLAGLAGLILIPLVCVLLAVTVIGIPLAIVLFALYCVAVLLSGVFVSYLIGGWLRGRLKRPETSPYGRLAVGALVVSFFASLPLFGWIVQALVLVIGFGALILERRDSWQRLPAESHA
jgi:cytoskeletal protein CcmA (bactofilin family)